MECRAGPGIRVTDPVWPTHFRINERKVSDYRHGRVCLAGDAAHIHSPAGGQGMNTGMQDATNLAWKLAMVVRGQAGTTLLDGYSPERSAVGTMVLRNAGRLTAVATPVVRAARNLALRVLLGSPAVRTRMAATMSETEIAYADSPLSRGAGSGERWPPENAAGPPPGSGTIPLLALYGGDPGRGSALAARFPALLEAAPRSPPRSDRLTLVRPDGYVGLSAGRDAWAEAERYLADFGAGR